jgi:hypothetical protein
MLWLWRWGALEKKGERNVTSPASASRGRSEEGEKKGEDPFLYLSSEEINGV